jgi:hypothetical protein
MTKAKNPYSLFIGNGIFAPVELHRSNWGKDSVMGSLPQLNSIAPTFAPQKLLRRS